MTRNTLLYFNTEVPARSEVRRHGHIGVARAPSNAFPRSCFCSAVAGSNQNRPTPLRRSVVTVMLDGIPTDRAALGAKSEKKIFSAGE